ncbi:MAG: hypothetical protein J0M02_01395 [Planctomycetes bacterium]|nr:hypothetical protein [Planctomycetota bacterium]
MPIASRQNETLPLTWLSAQRHGYTAAKRLFGLQMFVAGPVALAGSVWLWLDPSPKPYLAIWGFAFAVLDLLLIAPALQKMREDSARIQEAFDAYVLGIEWNPVKIGRRPDPEAVVSLADAYAAVSPDVPGRTVWSVLGKPVSAAIRGASWVLARFGIAPSKQGLENWYSPAVDRIPERFGRIVCQRENCAYDMCIRRRYANTVLACTIILALAIVLIPVTKGFDAKTLILASLAPAAPLLLLGIRNFRENRAAGDRSQRIKDALERVWAEALAGLDEATLAARSRQIQDEIFEHRRSSPLVFDSVYNAMRNKLERRAAFSVEQMVAEAAKVVG